MAAMTQLQLDDCRETVAIHLSLRICSRAIAGPVVKGNDLRSECGLCPYPGAPDGFARGSNTSVINHLGRSNIAFEKMVGCMDEAQVHSATSEL